MRVLAVLRPISVGPPPTELCQKKNPITNSGNVPLTDIHVSDSHENGEAHGETFDSASYAGALGDEPGQWNLAETTPAVFGANEDSKADDASFGTLGVGGVVTFTYAHQVTQAEFDAQ